MATKLGSKARDSGQPCLSIGKYLPFSRSRDVIEINVVTEHPRPWPRPWGWDGLHPPPEVAHGHQKIDSKTRNLSTLDHCNSAADPVAI